MGKHLAQLKARQDQLGEEMEHQLSKIDTRNLFIAELQMALHVAKNRQAGLVARYRATYQKSSFVSDAIFVLEPDVDDLTTKSELC